MSITLREVVSWNKFCWKCWIDRIRLPKKGYFLQCQIIRTDLLDNRKIPKIPMGTTNFVWMFSVAWDTCDNNPCAARVVRNSVAVVNSSTQVQTKHSLIVAGIEPNLKRANFHGPSPNYRVTLPLLLLQAHISSC